MTALSGGIGPDLASHLVMSGTPRVKSASSFASARTSSTTAGKKKSPGSRSSAAAWPAWEMRGRGPVGPGLLAGDERLHVVAVRRDHGGRADLDRRVAGEYRVACPDHVAKEDDPGEDEHDGSDPAQDQPGSAERGGPVRGDVTAVDGERGLDRVQEPGQPGYLARREHDEDSQDRYPVGQHRRDPRPEHRERHFRAGEAGMVTGPWPRSPGGSGRTTIAARSARRASGPLPRRRCRTATTAATRARSPRT
jgi:hypothetical protein